MTNAQFAVERAEKARDLRNQMETALGADEEQEFQFYEWSPGRTYVTLWSMETGEAITLPRYQAETAINIVNPDGGYRFTAYQERAPEPVAHTTKCFLHRDSPERPLLEEMGIIASGELGCSANTLANESSKWNHARSRHSARLQQYEAEIARRERKEWEARQEQQAQAMLALAQSAAPRRGRPPKDQEEDE